MLLQAEQTVLNNYRIPRSLKEKVDIIQKQKRMYRIGVVEEAIQTFLTDYEKGKIEISRQMIEEPKIQFITDISLSLNEKLENLIQQVNQYVEQLPPPPKGTRKKKLTQTKLITQILEYWLQKEGYTHE
jgi:hypothetical protein